MAIQPTHHKISKDGGGALPAAREAALAFLTRRIRSESEVRRRLGSQYSASVVEQVVQWLKIQGFVDDAVLATEWRQQRERSRPKGEAMIRRELMGQGIDRQVVDQALEGFDAPENAYQAARGWWSKHSSVKRPLKRRLEDSSRDTFTETFTDSSTDDDGESGEYFKLRRRLWSYLQRRGFEAELIGDTVRRLRSELSDSLNGGVDADTHEQ